MTSRSKNVAGLLAIFLGSIGAHRFYLGSYWWGILYFLFSWTLVPGLVGILEGIRYLVMDEEKFNAKYSAESDLEKGNDPPQKPSTSKSKERGQRTEPTIEVSLGIEGATGGSQLSTEEKLEQSAEAWVPPGEGVTINGYDIPDGMLYVGTELDSVEEFYGADGCLINPTLDIDNSREDHDGTRMSYWPSYSEIDSGCRATYLKWLAGGRRDPDIDIGYVFLFYYGLERRALFDAKNSSQARSETSHIISEVEELLEIYDEESSFSGYATEFSNLLRAKYDQESLTDISRKSRRHELPLGKRVKIGRRIADSDSINPELAYEWFLHAPRTYRRTPGRRCEDEFKNLFLIRYEERFDEGLIVEMNNSPITISYRPASRSLSQEETIEIDGVVDIEELSEPLDKLQELANDCCDELDSYSRYVGKNEERESLEALSLLPKPILKRRQTDTLTEFLEASETELDRLDLVETKLDVFLSLWPIEPGSEVRKRDLRHLAILLEKLGFGLEPDVRFSAPSRGWGDPAVLYRLPPESGSETSAISEDIRLIQKLAITIVLSNDEVAPEQTEYIAENLGTFLDLGKADQIRLDAHRRWLLLDSPTLHGVRQRAEDLPDDLKPKIAKFLTALACSDGQIDQEEIQELTKIYPMLGLDEDLVHTHLHELQIRSSSTDDDPVTIQKAEPTSTDYEIPEPDKSDGPRTEDFELDPERVNRTLEESKEVSEFLADIFEEDDSQSEPDTLESEPSPNHGSQKLADGELDEEHREFLVILSKKSQWDREEVEEVAREKGLFPDAAIEVINDYAFELVETPIIEGGEQITVDQTASRKVIE